MHGFQNQASHEKVSALWDSGSSQSFWNGKETSEEWKLVWEGREYTFPSFLQVFPKQFDLVIGTDFFHKTCILWSDEKIYVYESQASFCKRPDVFLSLALKFIQVRERDGHYYTQLEKEGQKVEALLDTGASFSILPETLYQNRELIESVTVHLPRGETQTRSLFKTKESIYFQTTNGELFSKQIPLFLGGISKDGKQAGKEGLWVIGLNALSQSPVFWDFSRARVAFYLQ
ncbi:hypothetical protein LPTSP4_10930 [Leptospira ryugenii]|uniref:Peptidase A2 domain-containing protein n=1 Tax=Leptospira ryugenii TaxID=1917863 RepID=A0A2P2DY68_9LEPT|nr:hypothetical protein LPTSP4_10930 [Leptospira ryugenii]